MTGHWWGYAEGVFLQMSRSLTRKFFFPVTIYYTCLEEWSLYARSLLHFVVETDRNLY
jgi:hypothetical protein